MTVNDTTTEESKISISEGCVDSNSRHLQIMNQNNSVKQLITNKVNTFCQHCSLHGVIYFHGRHRRPARAAWALVVALNVVLWVFLTNMIWTKYTVDPTFTVVESSRYPISRIPFPSVIVCDPEIVYGPNTKNITYILKLRGYDAKQIDAFYRSFKDIQQSNYTIEPNIQKMHFILHDLDFSYIRLLRILSKPCDTLLMECAWRFKRRNCKEMFRQVYTHRGFCCQFDISYFIANALDNRTSFVAGVEAPEAFDFKVNPQKVAANGTQYDGHVSIHILDEEHQMSIIDNSITVTPAGMFDIHLHVWAIDSAQEVKALPLAYRNCLLNSDPTIWPRYYEGCMSRIVLQKTANYCRCLPFNFTSKELHVDEFPRCTWERLKCIYETNRKTKTEISNLSIRGNCLVKCDYVHYETQTEYTMQNRQYLGMNGSNSHVFIHFTGPTCMKYRREVLFTWDQMLANLGGIFGLCLGGSIISIIELLWFILELIFEVLLALRRETNKKVPKKANKIFTLTQNDFIHKSSAKKNKKLKFVNNYPFVH